MSVRLSVCPHISSEMPEPICTKFCTLSRNYLTTPNKKSLRKIFTSSIPKVTKPLPKPLPN